MKDWLVVTPTLGQSPWLGETVASVAALPRACRHVLVCPAAMRAELATRFPDTLVVEEPVGGGMYAAINAGIAAVPEWTGFTYINDDDVLVADGFAKALALRAAQPDADLLYGRVVLVDAAGARLGALPVATTPADLPALLVSRIMPLAQPGTWISRRIWDQLKGFDESYRLAGDLDFFVRALAAGARFAFVDASVAAFRIRAGQLSKQGELMEQETVRALRTLAGVSASLGARWRFRLGNLGVYVERVRRHGLISMHELQARGK